MPRRKRKRRRTGARRAAEQQQLQPQSLQSSRRRQEEEEEMDLVLELEALEEGGSGSEEGTGEEGLSHRKRRSRGE